MPLVYAELRRVAHRYMRGQLPGHELQTTALVHEAYLRLIGSSRVSWRDRSHFFAVSAQLMRRVLVDAVRQRRALKRGGQTVRLSLDAARHAGPTAPDVVALDDALRALAELDPRKSRVVELRYFGGLTVEEVAEVLRVSVPTVEREWRIARLWLSKALGGGA